ncbi:hypothetical protein F2Q70_00023958 [Brassica cretica]|uniref:FH2 domain-containing protein n=1 Tax=Brassica cretica TaxID=69181 RepID=A0A8S9GVS5_BRACR|nr:hypothetical protein F2Q70_00023958 [Brassica cretica]
MVYFRQIFLMIIVVAISLHCCSISADERYRTQIGKLVGENGGGKRKFAVLEKFRALLDLIKPSTPRRRNLAASPWPAPSPSPYPNGGPVESPAYSPAPQRPIPPHLRRPLPQRTHPPGQHEIQSRKHEEGGVFVPLVVSTACGIGFVVCVVVVLCLCSRVRKKNGKTLSFKRKKRKSQKVSINPTLDFLYLNSVGVDLERQSSVLVKETENDDELREEEVKTSVETEILLDSDNAGSYSTKEIVSVQEKTEHSVSASEDEESFHSVGDGSQYSNPRLSNASSFSVSGIGSFSQRFSERELDIPECSGISHPPPPPPPPPQLLQFSNRGLLHTRSSLETAKPRTLSSQLSARVCDSSSKPLPPPPPPPPPPLSQQQQPQVMNKAPPPPLSLDFTQRTPLGKDGAPLPKLKPLHWDKVRATPDRTMVWDKIRTSSFEFDEEMIESLFGYTMQTSSKNEEGRCKTPSPGKHLLEPKRLQNFTILLKALNATADQICSALGKGKLKSARIDLIELNTPSVSYGCSFRV